MHAVNQSAASNCIQRREGGRERERERERERRGGWGEKKENRRRGGRRDTPVLGEVNAVCAVEVELSVVAPHT